MLAPLLPLLALLGVFVVGLAVFSVQSRLGKRLVDEDVVTRPASRLLGRFLRHYMMWLLAPLEALLVRWRVPPNAITLTSLVLALGSAGALASGHFATGGWLYLCAGILDILDGRVARASGRVSRGGAFFDSVIDRYAEMLVFAGLAIYFRNAWAALGLVLAAAMGSVMVSYARARGEALGVDVRVGTMQRPERLFYLGVVMAHSPLWEALVGGRGQHLLVVGGLAVLALSSNVTALVRIVHTLRTLDPPPAPAAPHQTRVGRGVVHLRGTDN